MCFSLIRSRPPQPGNTEESHSYGSSPKDRAAPSPARGLCPDKLPSALPPGHPGPPCQCCGLSSWPLRGAWLLRWWWWWGVSLVLSGRSVPVRGLCTCLKGCLAGRPLEVETGCCCPAWPRSLILGPPGCCFPPHLPQWTGQHTHHPWGHPRPSPSPRGPREGGSLSMGCKVLVGPLRSCFHLDLCPCE